MTSRSADFIRDISRLLTKYGPEPFTELARVLADPQSRDQAVASLTALAEAAAVRKRPEHRVSPSEKMRRLIESAGREDPDRGQLLGDAQSLLSAITKPYLLDTAARLSIVTSDRDTPAKVTAKIVEYLYRLPTDAIREQVAILKETTPQTKGGLEAWDDIIMAGHRRGSGRSRRVAR